MSPITKRLTGSAAAVLALAACSPPADNRSSTTNAGKTAAGSQNGLAGAPVGARDAFYTPPARVPSQPGALLRSEPLAGVTLPPGVRAWRILYTTSVNDRTPAIAAATIFAPAAPPPGPRPVITWEHGTTGLVQRCMPSLSNAPAAGIPAQAQIVRDGWVVVATDYGFAEPGGPHPFMIGEGEARAGLDSVRAARRLPGLSLQPRTVVWGHSQGGHGALWTGVVGPRYAPEIEILGVAAIAPAADMMRLVRMNPALDRTLGPYVASAYSRFYPEFSFDSAVRPAARDAAREMAGLCGSSPSEAQRLAALAGSEVLKEGVLTLDSEPGLTMRLRENIASGPISPPVLIAQGLNDPVVVPAATDAWVGERCAAGQRLEYLRYAGLDHNGIVAPGSPLAEPLALWTRARFRNEPQAPGCRRRNL